MGRRGKGKGEEEGLRWKEMGRKKEVKEERDGKERGKEGKGREGKGRKRVAMKRKMHSLTITKVCRRR